MPETGPFTLGKEERINSRLLIEKLFGGGGSRAMSAFPIRMVYRFDDVENMPQAAMMVSVSKRRFKHAVDRNRVKRQMREAYRKNKYILLDRLEGQPERRVSMAFIWIDDRLHPSVDVETSMRNLLMRLSEKL